MKFEPLSIISVILAIASLFTRGLAANFLLLSAAILVILSYKQFKKNSRYKIKWPLKASIIIVILVLVAKSLMYIINML